MDAATSLAAFLQLDGHAVRVVHTGEAALQDVLSFHPDVVLLDIGLPVVDGYQVARRIRAAGLLFASWPSTGETREAARTLKPRVPLASMRIS